METYNMLATKPSAGENIHTLMLETYPERSSKTAIYVGPFSLIKRCDSLFHALSIY